jgi:hypothetical protein
MKTRKRTAVIVILLVLLAGALGNLFLIDHVYRNAVKAIEKHEEIARATAAGTLPGSISGPGLARSGSGPAWYGDVRLARTPAGGYDLVAYAIDGPAGGLVALESAEIEAKKPGDGKGAITPELKKDAEGRFAAHVDFPEKGAWELRVRLHRPLQTFEFTRRITVE